MIANTYERVERGTTSNVSGNRFSAHPAAIVGLRLREALQRERPSRRTTPSRRARSRASATRRTASAPAVASSPRYIVRKQPAGGVSLAFTSLARLAAAVVVVAVRRGAARAAAAATAAVPRPPRPGASRVGRVLRHPQRSPRVRSSRRAFSPRSEDPRAESARGELDGQRSRLVLRGRGSGSPRRARASRAAPTRRRARA